MLTTDDFVAIAEYIVGQLRTDFAQVTTTDQAITLWADAIFYGDQHKIPKAPTLCVEPGPYLASLIGASASLPRKDNTIQLIFMLYHGKIQDVQLTRQQCDELARSLMKYLDSQRTTMGGRVIFGHVISIEPGYAVRGGDELRAARITWEGKSRTTVGG